MPQAEIDDGLPYCTSKYGNIALTTSGCTAVEAALSR